MRKLLALLLGAALVAASPAYAAIALVNNGLAAFGNGTSVAISTVAASIELACVAADQSNGSGQTVSDNRGNTWARITRIPGSGGSFQTELWYAFVTSANASTTITYSGNFARFAAASFSGTATSSVLDGAVTSATQSFSTSLQPGSITPSQANGMLATCFAADPSAATIAINGGFTITDSATANLMVGLGYLVQTTATAANPTWSGYASTTAHAAMQAFKDPGGGGGGPTTVPLRSLMGVGQ